MKYDRGGFRAMTAALVCLLINGAVQGITLNPTSSSGLDYYAQGGVVLDGVAYFTANPHFADPNLARDQDFPSVVAFNANTFQKSRTYAFRDTYDSSPLAYSTSGGTPLVIAHEHLNARTVAIHRDTGKMVWTSAANQPGMYFFGYSYYNRPDGSKIVLTPSTNGLHAVNGDTGQDAWSVNRSSTGGVTPAVDQANAWVFYQRDGELLKINANTGSVLKSVAVGSPATCYSWNTVLTDDSHGAYVATYWYGANMWDSAVRVYDKELNMVWEKTGLPLGEKQTLTYADGKLLTGSGNDFGAHYSQSDPTWKKMVAYDIATGDVAWETDLSNYTYTAVLNAPYFNGNFYAEAGTNTATTPGGTTLLFRIDASTGAMEEVLDFGRPVSSCATSIIADGKLYTGDIQHDRIVVVELATGSSLDWPGPFGNPQTNQMALPFDPGATLVPMREILPEPSAAVLLGAGLMTLLCYAFRAKLGRA
jgi:hypothetical protein